MTQQYLVGELSVLLARLETVAMDQTTIRDAERLRREAETVPLPALSTVATRALKLSDALCWTSLTHGDMPAFSRQATVSAELYEFGVCAGLLEDN